jgi:hypothetical protein
MSDTRAATSELFALEEKWNAGTLSPAEAVRLEELRHLLGSAAPSGNVHVADGGAPLWGDPAADLTGAQPAYDPAAYDPATYDPAAYDPAAYDPAAYDAAGYAAGTHDAAAYAAGAQDPAAYDPAAYATGAQAPATYDAAAYAAASHDPAAYDAAAYAAGAQDPAAYDAAAYAAASHDPAAYDAAAYAAASHDPAAYDATAYAAASDDAATHDPAAYDPAGQAAGSHDPSAYDAAAYAAGSHDPSADAPGSYDPSAYDAAAYAAGAYAPAQDAAQGDDAPLAEAAPYDPAQDAAHGYGSALDAAHGYGSALDAAHGEGAQLDARALDGVPSEATAAGWEDVKDGETAEFAVADSSESTPGDAPSSDALSDLPDAPLAEAALPAEPLYADPATSPEAVEAEPLPESAADAWGAVAEPTDVAAAGDGAVALDTPATSALDTFEDASAYAPAEPLSAEAQPLDATAYGNAYDSNDETTETAAGLEGSAYGEPSTEDAAAAPDAWGSSTEGASASEAPVAHDPAAYDAAAYDAAAYDPAAYDAAAYDPAAYAASPEDPSALSVAAAAPAGTEGDEAFAPAEVAPEEASFADVELVEADAAVVLEETHGPVDPVAVPPAQPTPVPVVAAGEPLDSSALDIGSEVDLPSLQETPPWMQPEPVPENPLAAASGEGFDADMQFDVAGAETVGMPAAASDDASFGWGEQPQTDGPVELSDGDVTAFDAPLGNTSHADPVTDAAALEASPEPEALSADAWTDESPEAAPAEALAATATPEEAWEGTTDGLQQPPAEGAWGTSEEQPDAGQAWEATASSEPLSADAGEATAHAEAWGTGDATGAAADDAQHEGAAALEAQPDEAAAAYGETAYAETAYGESAYGESAYGESAYGAAENPVTAEVSASDGAEAGAYEAAPGHDGDNADGGDAALGAEGAAGHEVDASAGSAVPAEDAFGGGVGPEGLESYGSEASALSDAPVHPAEPLDADGAVLEDVPVMEAEAFVEAEPVADAEPLAEAAPLEEAPLEEAPLDTGAAWAAAGEAASDEAPVGAEQPWAAEGSPSDAASAHAAESLPVEDAAAAQESAYDAPVPAAPSWASTSAAADAWLYAEPEAEAAPVAEASDAAAVVEADPIEAEPIEAEPIEAEPIEAAPIEASAFEAAPAEAEAVDAAQAHAQEAWDGGGWEAGSEQEAPASPVSSWESAPAVNPEQTADAWAAPEVAPEAVTHEASFAAPVEAAPLEDVPVEDGWQESAPAPMPVEGAPWGAAPASGWDADGEQQPQDAWGTEGAAEPALAVEPPAPELAAEWAEPVDASAEPVAPFAAEPVDAVGFEDAAGPSAAPADAWDALQAAPGAVPSEWAEEPAPPAAAEPAWAEEPELELTADEVSAEPEVAAELLEADVAVEEAPLEEAPLEEVPLEAAAPQDGADMFGSAPTGGWEEEPAPVDMDLTPRPTGAPAAAPADVLELDAGPELSPMELATPAADEAPALALERVSLGGVEADVLEVAMDEVAESAAAPALAGHAEVDEFAFDGAADEPVPLATNSDFIEPQSYESRAADLSTEGTSEGFEVEMGSVAELATNHAWSAAPQEDAPASHEAVAEPEPVDLGELELAGAPEATPEMPELELETIELDAAVEEAPAPAFIAVAPAAPAPAVSASGRVSQGWTATPAPVLSPPPPPAPAPAAPAPATPVWDITDDLDAAPVEDGIDIDEPEPRTSIIQGESRVILHTVEGQVKRGLLRDVDLEAAMVSLEQQTGLAPERIATQRVKAVFFMLAPGQKPSAVAGQKVRVTFHDGRQLAGFSTDALGAAPGFFLVPADNRTNTERIYIYRSAVQAVAEG